MTLCRTRGTSTALCAHGDFTVGAATRDARIAASESSFTAASTVERERAASNCAKSCATTTSTGRRCALPRARAHYSVLRFDQAALIGCRLSCSVRRCSLTASALRSIIWLITREHSMHMRDGIDRQNCRKAVTKLRPVRTIGWRGAGGLTAVKWDGSHNWCHPRHCLYCNEEAS